MVKKKNIKIIIMIVAQILLLAGLLVYAQNRHLEQYWYDGSQLVYIDVNEEERKIYTPQQYLETGSYEFEMTYETTGEQAVLQFTNYGYESDDIGTNSLMELYAGEHVFHTNFRVLQSVEGFIGVIEYPASEEFKVNSILLSQTNQSIYNTIFGLLILFMVVDTLGYLYIKKNLKFSNDGKETLGALFIAVFFSSLPLLLNYLMNGHDLEFHLLRIEGIAEALSDGNFPVRMHPNFMEGYGYPTGIYYPELFLYFPAVLHWLGIPLMNAYKYFLLLENIVTALAAWYAAKIILKNNRYASLFCILYTLLPYRMVNEYYRAAVGESLAMIFLPLLIAAMYLLLSKNPTGRDLRKASVLLVVAVSGVLQSHILSCEIYAIFGFITVIMCMGRFIRPRVLLTVVISIIGTLLLNLWFLVPFFEASKLDVNVLYNTPGNIASHSLNLWQLLAFTPEASGNSKMIIKGVATEMPLYLGWTVIVCICIALIGMKKNWKLRQEEMSATGLLCFVCGGVAAWMTTCLFPWNMIGNIPKIGRIMNTVQFPWRYLGVAGCLLLIAGIIALKMWDNKEKQKKAAVFLVGISLFISLSLCQSMVENRNYYSVYDGAGLDSYAVVGREYLYYGTNLTTLEQESRIEDWYTIEKGTVICSIEGAGIYNLPLLYYPWYEAKDVQTGEILSIIKGENNVAVLNVPEDYSGTVVVEFEEPVLWKISTMISVIAGVAFMIFLVSLRNKKCLSDKEKKNRNIA